MRPPFPWPCNQRSLPWRGDQIVAMSYCWIPMNIMGQLVMRPPILLVRSCFIIFLRVPSVSYREAFYCLLGDPLGKASLGFISYGFYLLPASFPPGPLAPSSHKTKCNPKKVILMAGLGEWDRCAGDRMKNDRMVGAERWLCKSPLVANQNP
jgi:hypothetical protein